MAFDRSLWKGVPQEVSSTWRDIFDRNPTSANLKESCPICGKRSLHQYYLIDSEEHRVVRGVRFRGSGSLWEWCGWCRHYEHMSALVPEGWDFNLELDPAKLRHDPSYINEIFEPTVNRD